MGDAFTPEAEAAWGEVYATLAAAMQGGAGQGEQAEALAFAR